MQLSDFDYNLPDELIAQAPVSPRHDARLLVLSKQTGQIKNDRFFNLPHYLKRGDVLVLNNSKVFPARLIGRKETTGGKAEILLERELEPGLWQAIGRNLAPDLRLTFAGSNLQVVVIGRHEELWRIRFNLSGQALFAAFDQIGLVPLPPYINHQRKLSGRQSEVSDRQEYQTVYAKNRGSVAAPTAGMHFTPELLKMIRQMGVEIVEITLHVGLGTFAPIKSTNILKHKMHSERFSLSLTVLEQIRLAKREGRRIIAVGTTTTRVLEYLFSQKHPKGGYTADASVADGSFYASRSTFQELSGETDIFIYPGYKFKCIDGLITNFHLPKSSLLLLVSAFAGKERIDWAYQRAIRGRYRFYSYGDAMLII